MQPCASSYTVWYMGVRQDDNLRWLLIEPGVLVRVEGEMVAGLLMYGDITAQRLRAVRLGRLDHIPRTSGVYRKRDSDGAIPLPYRFPEWRQEEPPTPEQARAAESELAKKQPMLLVPKGSTRTSAALRRLIKDATVRREGESAADFYARFSEMFLTVATSTPSPNQLIAQVSGLSTNVVKQYVHRSRTLGHLAPTRRSHP